MDKIKEVQQILNNHALPTNNGGFIRDSLDGSKFNKIAQDIVKLFAIPDVVGQSEPLKDFSEFCQDNYSFKIPDRIVKDYEQSL